MPEQPRFLDTMNCDHKEYLWNTFIFVMREMETGEPIPPVIAQKRQEAWAAIQANGGLNSDDY